MFHRMVRLIEKIKRKDFSNIFITIIFALMVISVIPSHESSLFGLIGPVLFTFITAPVLFIGVLIVFFQSILAFLKKDYFAKGFSLSVFLCHILLTLAIGGIIFLIIRAIFL